MSEQAEIAWYTPPVGDGVGYGYAAVEIIYALQRKNIKVSYDSPGPLVHVSFVQPDWYRGLTDQFKIGYSPWESSDIPEQWIEPMQRMEEIWTPCQYNADIFRSYDVNDVIRVVPHGVDPEIWKIEERFLRDKFVFLHIGGPTERKGGQKVVDAFLELFGGNEDVLLVMKSNGPSECRFYDKGWDFKNIKYHPQVMVIEERISTDDLANLYAKSHCLVYPTNGEGFGLIPFQGIASGLPTIVTDATACHDYAHLALPLKSTTTTGVGVHLGEWAEPDVDHLRELMLYVVENYDVAREKALQSARIIHNTQTWDHIADQIVDILGDKIYSRL